MTDERKPASSESETERSLAEQWARMHGFQLRTEEDERLILEAWRLERSA